VFDIIHAMPPTAEQRHIIDVLALEYAALRGDIVHRSAARFSMLSVALTVFAVLAALLQLSDQISLPFTGGVIAVYLGAVLLAWLDAGRSIARLSDRLVELEDQINKLTNNPTPLLKWETEQQRRRGPFGRFFLGST
jgi:hypothetical protein